MTLSPWEIASVRVTGLSRDTFTMGNIHGYVKKSKETAHDIKLSKKLGFSIPKQNNGVWHLQTADCRLHEAARLLIKWNQKYRNKGGVIINITLFREVRPRSEVYIFHANYTDLIPKGAVGCSFRI